MHSSHQMTDCEGFNQYFSKHMKCNHHKQNNTITRLHVNCVCNNGLLTMARSDPLTSD